MGRIGIIYQDVVKVIPKLQAQGKTVTVDNMRAELGRGSKSTIARLLREWKQQQGLPVDDNGSLPSELLTAVKELWRLLQAKADDAIDGYREEYDTALKEIQQQLNQYKAKDTESKDRVHTLEEKLHQQTEDNRRLNAEIVTERQENIKAVERAESLQARHLESEAEKERLHQLLKHVQANLEHYQAATQQLRLEQDMIVEKQRAGYEQRLLQLQEKVEVMAREKTFLEARCAGLDRDYNASLVREAAVTEEVVQLHQKCTTLEVNYATLKQNFEEGSEELIAQRQSLEAKSRELMECHLKLKIAEDQKGSLQEALSAAEDKIVALRDDYLFVAQEKANLAGQVEQLQEIVKS